MNRERLMKILLSPHNSEKSVGLADRHRQFAFKVTCDANKREVARAVELMFDVKVDSVRTLNVKGKRKRFGASQGRRANWKKAYVTLKEGNDIDFSSL